MSFSKSDAFKITFISKYCNLFHGSMNKGCFGYLALFTLLLALTLTLFKPVGFEGAESLLQILPLPESKERVKAQQSFAPIKIWLLEADMGIAQHFQGNESIENYTPIEGAFVRIGFYSTITDELGRATLVAPLGAQTLKICRDSGCWSKEIEIDGNMSLVIKFVLYRINPEKIRIELDPLKPEQDISLSFRLPASGEYYIGSPTISYYDQDAQVKAYRSGLENSVKISLPTTSENLLTASPLTLAKKIEESLGTTTMNYTKSLEGGISYTSTLKIAGKPVLVVPDLTFIPVEKVVVEVSEKKP